jgi:phospholipid N-methyltransferase
MPSLQRLRPQPDNRIKFFNEFIRSPGLVGSVIPSSRFLERRIVQTARISTARNVVELGPGTGGTTRAILRALAPDSRLLAIELSRRFASLLAAHPDPRLCVHHGSATDIGPALAAHGMQAPDVVLSGIPFSTMPARVGREILAQVWEKLAPGGQFVAYQFRDRVAVLGSEIFGPPRVKVEMLNVPPMRFYCWRKPGAAANSEESS